MFVCHLYVLNDPSFQMCVQLLLSFTDTAKTSETKNGLTVNAIAYS